MVWFWAAFLMITDRCGFSALALQRQLGIARYETAWMILRKLRRATVNANRTKLRGRVEAGEIWIGGVQSGGTGRKRHGRNAALAVLALEVSKGFPGDCEGGSLSRRTRWSEGSDSEVVGHPSIVRRRQPIRLPRTAADGTEGLVRRSASQSSPD
jgi:hypothetical protein